MTTTETAEWRLPIGTPIHVRGAVTGNIREAIVTGNEEWDTVTIGRPGLHKWRVIRYKTADGREHTCSPQYITLPDDDLARGERVAAAMSTRSPRHPEDIATRAGLPLDVVTRILHRAEENDEVVQSERGFRRLDY